MSDLSAEINFVDPVATILDLTNLSSDVSDLTIDDDSMSCSSTTNYTGSLGSFASAVSGFDSPQTSATSGLDDSASKSADDGSRCAWTDTSVQMSSPIPSEDEIDTVEYYGPMQDLDTL